MSRLGQLFACLLAFAALAFAGCGGTLECGQGTMESDGECVPAAESCGEGTKLVDGACVLASAQIECADGTTKQDGKCVPETTCGPETRPDATGECVPTYDRVECARGTTREGDECVSSRFLIENVDFPDQVVASENPGGNLQDLSISWSGEPAWPVEVRVITTGECPANLECGVAYWTFDSSQNPIQIPDAYGCYGQGAVGTTFQKAVVMVDADDTFTNLADMTFDCVGQ